MKYSGAQPIRVASQVAGEEGGKEWGREVAAHVRGREGEGRERKKKESLCLLNSTCNRGRWRKRAGRTTEHISSTVRSRERDMLNWSVCR